MDIIVEVFNMHEEQKVLLANFEELKSAWKTFVDEHEELKRRINAVFAYLDMLDKDWRASVGFTE